MFSQETIFKLFRSQFSINCGQSLWSNQRPMGLERTFQEEVKTGLDIKRANNILSIVKKTVRPGSKILWVWLTRQSCRELNVLCQFICQPSWVHVPAKLIEECSEQDSHRKEQGSISVTKALTPAYIMLFSSGVLILRRYSKGKEASRG